MTCCALVLAAGRSSRMGSPKALLPYAGRPFLDALVERLERARGVGKVGVVLGADAQTLRRTANLGNALALVNEAYEQGMFSSVHTGASGMLVVEPRLTSLLVCLVDQPAVRVATYERLAEGELGPFDVRVAACHGVPGHPIRVGRGLVEALAAADLYGARLDDFLLRTAADQEWVETSDPAVLQNINTPASYQALLVH